MYFIKKSLTSELLKFIKLLLSSIKYIESFEFMKSTLFRLLSNSSIVIGAEDDIIFFTASV